MFSAYVVDMLRLQVVEYRAKDGGGQQVRDEAGAVPTLGERGAQR